MDASERGNKERKFSDHHVTEADRYPREIPTVRFYVWTADIQISLPSESVLVNVQHPSGQCH